MKSSEKIRLMVFKKIFEIEGKLISGLEDIQNKAKREKRLIINVQSLSDL